MSRGRARVPTMSALGQKQTSELVRAMSALPPIADIGTQSRNVCFVPKADIGREGLVRRRPLSGTTPVVGAPDIEDVQYRAIGRRSSGALGDCCCQQAFQFAQIANLRADVIEMMRSDLANFLA